jgi:Zn-dependent peptidase ImmA (M78 family)
MSETIERTADYKKAASAARRVLRENNIVRPPIVPREIAEAYSLEVIVANFPAQFEDVAGFIRLAEKQIYVNAKDHYNRQTFTVAHELGHYLLHKELFESHPEKYKVLLRRPIGAENEPIEKEANAFAADLLVPLEMLKSYCRFADEKELAVLFAVSTDVIRYRLRFAGQAVS